MVSIDGFLIRDCVLLCVLECGRGGLPTCEALRNALFSATTRVNPSPPSTLKLPQSLGPITEEYLGAFYEDS